MLILLGLSSCEPMLDILLDDLLCTYNGYQTHVDNMNKCYYINDVGIRHYIDDSHCKCHE